MHEISDFLEFFEAWKAPYRSGETIFGFLWKMRGKGKGRKALTRAGKNFGTRSAFSWDVPHSFFQGDTMESLNQSRRRLLIGGSLGLASAALAQKAAAKEAPRFDKVYDVIVVGSGFAGLAAALIITVVAPLAFAYADKLEHHHGELHT